MIQKGFFVITDISGYTLYLSKSELDHANDILKSLFATQISHIKQPVKISNFQGDAILSYVLEKDILQKQTLIEMVEEIYYAFTRKKELIMFNTSCTCNACKNISGLDLKIFIHYGDFMVQELAGRKELLGSDVILAHRMMKNQVVEQTGVEAYALFTERAAESLELAEFCEDLKTYKDSYEHVDEVNMYVHCLKTQWEKEKEKTRNVVSKEEAWVAIEVEIDVSPAVVWDYLTKIDIKLQMLGFSIGGRLDVLGGRIREGSLFHCAHGELEFRYKVVDWNAFKYFTCYETGPNDIIYYNTYHLTPTESGTLFANYVRIPESGPIEETKELMQNIWDQAFPNLKPFIEQATSQSTSKSE